MASIRGPRRADGTGWAVLYAFNGQQTSTTWDTKTDAEEFRDAIAKLGVERAMKAWDVRATVRASKRSTAPTLTEWLRGYIDSRTGVTKACLYDYESYLKHDINPVLGAIPIDLLTPDDIAAWVQGLAAREVKPGKTMAGKTIANRHGFLSAALNTAVEKRVIVHNPAAGTRIPRTERGEMVFLTHPEFDILRTAFTERWRNMLEFMVASGARFGEFSALRPGDVDKAAGTVRITRAWKRTYGAGGYELGSTKTKRSDRTINIDPALLSELDYSSEFLFTNSKGGPIRAASFRNNVWYPAVAKAHDKGLEKTPRIHDMRHTCASWMIANGEPLPVIQRHLGHESIATTVNLYGHLDRASSAKAAKGIGAMLRPSPTS